MTTNKYKKEVENTVKLIDIAIYSISQYPLKGFNKQHIDKVIDSYIDAKKRAVSPESKYKNLTSLKYVTDEVLTIYQESSGEAVEFFWTKIKEEGLPYKRTNKVLKILKNKKIKNDYEYNFVIDIIVPYEQTGIITKEEALLLKKMIFDFEHR